MFRILVPLKHAKVMRSNKQQSRTRTLSKKKNSAEIFGLKKRHVRGKEDVRYSYNKRTSSHKLLTV